MVASGIGRQATRFTPDYCRVSHPITPGFGVNDILKLFRVSLFAVWRRAREAFEDRRVPY